MQKVFLFDVDGTLTPARQSMTDEFEQVFGALVQQYPVFVISGSDNAKIREQVPGNLLDACRGVFGSSGAELHVEGRKVYSKHHDFNPLIREACESFVDTSIYPMRCGNHVEERPGMLNVSVVGRNATIEERKRYHAWDQTVGERKRFADAINAAGLGYEATAGGEISIDIVPAGWNKSVVKSEVLRQFPDAQLHFFGDRIVEGGNDLPLAQALQADGNRHRIFAVMDFHETATILNRIMDCAASQAA